MNIQDIIAQAIADQKLFVQPSGGVSPGSGALPGYYNPANSGATYLIVECFLQFTSGGSQNPQPISVNSSTGIFGYKRTATVPTLGTGSQTPLKNATTGASCPLSTLGNADNGYSPGTPSVIYGANIDVWVNTPAYLSNIAPIQSTEPVYIYPGDYFGCVGTGFKSRGVFTNLTVVQVA